MSEACEAIGGSAFRRGVICVLALMVTLSYSFVPVTKDVAVAQDGSSVEPAYEFYFLVDTSGSMAGKGPGNPRDIFPAVQDNVNKFIDSLDVGDTDLFVYTFDKGIGETHFAALDSPDAKQQAKSFISSLAADGSMTYIYDSLSVVLDEAAEQRAAHGGRPVVQTIFLFTDGMDNSPNTTLSQIIDRFRLERGENDFLYFRYITLGTTAAEEWKQVPGAEVTDVDSDVPELPELLSVRIKPAALDFGSLAGRDASTRTLQLTYDPRLEGAVIDLLAASEDAEQAGALTQVAPAEVMLEASSAAEGSNVMSIDLELSVANKDGLSEGVDYAGRMSIAHDGDGMVAVTPPAVDFVFDVTPAAIISLEAGDRDSLSAELGELDPYEAEGRVERTVSTDVVFNDQARSAGSSVFARVSQADGPANELVSLLGPDGQPVEQLEITPEAPELTAIVSVPEGVDPGDYRYEIVLEPHDAELEGGEASETGQEGMSAYTVSFSVPEAPPPLWQTVLRWVLWILAGLLLLSVVAFVALMLMTGASAGRLASTLSSAVRPRMKDARLELLEPYDPENATVELTGKRRQELGMGTDAVSDMPLRLTFEPEVSVGSAKETLRVSKAADGDGSLMVERAATGVNDFGTAFDLTDGDTLIVEAGGSRYKILFSSFHYTS